MPKKRQLLIDFDVGETLPPEKSRLWSIEEIWDAESASLLASLAEDERIERKPANIHPPELAKWISMWSNTPPRGGLIVVERVLGVRPDGEADYALLFKVDWHPRRLVEDSKGNAYYRLGDSRIKLSDQQKQELRIDKGEIEFEQEICNLDWPGDFSIPAVRYFTHSVRQQKGLAAEHSDVEILTNHRLGKIVNGDFMPNIACALLFATDPRKVIPGSMIRFQRIEGEKAATGEDMLAE